IAENGDFRLKQVLMRGQNTKNSRDSVADLSLSVYFLFIRAVFRGALLFRDRDFTNIAKCFPLRFICEWYIGLNIFLKEK
ncbi:MAG: hypothetical protein Q8Q56_01725, partial [Alphaproteobacteria bacterium]|nr:hypothetical protein [Methylococcaceae bacterium]MDP3935697.1 hypothetical protein [Alphaproteobacteria bacterium]